MSCRILSKGAENTKSKATKAEHKIVNEEELTGHLDQGWELVRELNHSGKYLVRR